MAIICVGGSGKGKRGVVKHFWPVCAEQGSATALAHTRIVATFDLVAMCWPATEIVAYLKTFSHR